MNVKLQKDYVKFRMKFNIKILLILILIAIAVLFDDKICFYKFNETLEGTQFKICDQNKANVTNQNLWFTYSDKVVNHGNDQISLNYNPFIDYDNLKIFASTKDKPQSIANDKDSTLSSDYTGSFCAIAGNLSLDINSDSIKENVCIEAKTDTQFTQGFNQVDTYFGRDILPFETVLSDKNKLTFYYNDKLLANAKIFVSTTNDSYKEYETDDNGVISNIDIRQIRKGISFIYTQDGKQYYNLSYTVEANTLFTGMYMKALMPIILIVIISALIICAISIIRLKNKKNNEKNVALHIKYLFSIVSGKLKKIRITFQMVRWTCMIVSFILIIFGVRIFGSWISKVSLPVFACPKNTDVFIGSACYDLCHLSDFLKNNIKDIITFFVTTIIIIIVFGRTLCGFVCPLGFIQDIIYSVRNVLKIDGISVNERLYNSLKLIKWFMVIVFFGACTVGVDFCKFCPAVVTTPGFGGIRCSLYVSGFVIIIFFVLSFFKRRFWCNICPLGYIVGLFSKISLFKIRKNCQSCTECGACYAACPMGIKSIYTERKKEDITTSDCIMCGECVKKCPENDAIAVALGKRKIYVSSRFKFFSRNKKEKNIKMPFFHKEL